jgi:2-oxoglutarate ferredoxin oxidoreductase subunit delta
MTSKKKGPTVRPEKDVQRNESAKFLEKQSGRAKKRYSQTVFKDWCKRCGICSAFCPKNVIGRDEYGGPVFERPEDCIGCRFCELHCPDFAITVEELDPDNEGDK